MFGGVLKNLTSKLGKTALSEEAGALSGLVGRKAITKIEPKIASEIEAFVPKFSKSTGDLGIDKRIAEIVDMSPDDYLRKAFEATDGKLGGSYDSWLASNAVEPKTTKLYSEAMKRGDEFPLAYIDNAMGSQDGRNRALAVKMAGGKKMPVGVIPEMTDEQALKFYMDRYNNAEGNYLKAKYKDKVDSLKSKIGGSGNKTIADYLSDTGSGFTAPKNMGSGIKTPAPKGRTPNVIRDSISGSKVHPEDMDIMASAIDHARGITKLPRSEALKLEYEASRLAEHYGIPMNTKAKNPLRALADEFDKRLVKEGYKGK